MLTVLATHALLALAGPPALPGTAPADTVVPVSRGARLDVETGPQTGRVRIRAWDRDEVRVDAAEGVRVSVEGGLVRVRAAQALRADRGSTWDIAVPSWLPLRVSTTQAHLEVEGASADVTLETVRGTVRVRGGEGRVSARSVEGVVTVEDARGRVEASSVNAGVRVAGVSGQVHAEAVNGGVILERVESDDVAASTVNGSVDFDGPIRAGGHYRLSSHNGRVTLTVQEGASATVTVGTFNGTFRSAFPVSLTETGADRRFTFVIGGGSARIEASSFNGNVELRRPAP